MEVVCEVRIGLIVVDQSTGALANKHTHDLRAVRDLLGHARNAPCAWSCRPWRPSACTPTRAKCSSPNSAPRDRRPSSLSARSPPFDVIYGVKPRGRIADTDEMFTMDPPPPAAITGTHVLG